MIDSIILNLIKDKDNILIFPHIMADGDALGSAGALQAALKSLGKKCFIVIEDDLPSNLEFLDLDSFVNYEVIKNDSEVFELIIAVDSSDKDRLGERINLLDSCSTILNIDHHITNTNYGNYNLVDATAAACGEIIYQLIKDLKLEVNDTIATFLYVALTTDTGSFKYSNTTPKTLRIAADLLEYGIDKEDINVQLYQNKPLNKINLLTDTLGTLELFFNNRVSVMSIDLEMLSRNNIKFSDTDGIIEYGRDIKGVEASILLKETIDNGIKVGLRSKGNLDVSEIANHFNGGGHKNASGCTIRGSLEEAKKLLLEQFSLKIGD